MAEMTTIARPYARAAFEHAQAGQALTGWSEMLQFAAAVVTDADMQGLLASPDVSPQDKAKAVVDVCGDRLDAGGQNFIRLLADNRRLTALPAIAEVYEELRAEAERSVEAEVVTAFELRDEQKDSLAAALKRRLDRDVVLNCSVDETLIGGVKVRAGDLVIDGSAKGRLAKLATSLMQ